MVIIMKTTNVSITFYALQMLNLHVFVNYAFE